MSEASGPDSHSRGERRASGAAHALGWLALVVVLLAIAVRIERARTALFFGDEWHTLAVSGLGFEKLLATFDRFGTGIGMPLASRAVGTLFGTGQLAMRLPALLGGITTIVLTWWYGRRFLGPAVGATAALLVALNGFSIFYSGFARSYTIVSALALVLAGAVAGLRTTDRRLGGRLAGVVLATALLPYLHLTAAACALSIVGAGVLVLFVEGERGRALKLSIALGVGLLLGVLLHLPAWDGVQDFIGRKSKQKYPGSFGFVDVAALFVGHRGSTVVWLAASPIVAGLFLLRRRWGALPLIAAIVGPVLAVIAVRPFGDAYAYARYAIGALPFIALLFAWGISWLAQRISPARSEVLERCSGFVVAATLWILGPLGLAHASDGVFSNSYTTLYPLPAFAQDYDGAPEIYGAIAADPEAERILELPHLIHRGILMYRNYHLAHGKQVQTGFLTRPPASTPDGYPSLASEAWSSNLDVDYVVLHLDAVTEADGYWRSIYGGADDATAGVSDASRWSVATRAYMTRLEQVARGEERPDQRIVQRISNVFGDPVYRDAKVIAWRR